MKQALTIGINYVGTEYELKGCLNDAADWGSLFEMNSFTVTPLLEKEATKANIITAMTRLISSLGVGDVGAISISSHGSWIPDVENTELDGKVEVICPVDVGMDGVNMITGHEFKKLFDAIPLGAHVLFITDSCFSGTVYRMFGNNSSGRRVRFIPPAHLLKDKALVLRMDLAFGQPLNLRNRLPLTGLVHFSGCGDTEYSNDADFNNRPNGAMTYYAIKAFKEVLLSKGTYFDAWSIIRKSLPSWEYQQSPMLNAYTVLKNTSLLC